MVPEVQTYYIIKTKRCYETWEYAVEATSQEEALNKVKENQVQFDYHFVDEDEFFGTEYSFE